MSDLILQLSLPLKQTRSVSHNPSQKNPTDKSFDLCCSRSMALVPKPYRCGGFSPRMMRRPSIMMCARPYGVSCRLAGLLRAARDQVHE